MGFGVDRRRKARPRSSNIAERTTRTLTRTPLLVKVNPLPSENRLTPLTISLHRNVSRISSRSGRDEPRRKRYRSSERVPFQPFYQRKITRNGPTSRRNNYPRVRRALLPPFEIPLHSFHLYYAVYTHRLLSYSFLRFGKRRFFSPVERKQRFSINSATPSTRREF